ncbi:MAG: sensor histidine kinase [Rhodanobacteraceae bacterium]
MNIDERDTPRGKDPLVPSGYGHSEHADVATLPDLLQDGRVATFELPESADGVDLAALLVACAEGCSDLGDVEVDCEVDLPRVRGDAHALQRLFLEIMDNAFESGARAIVAKVGSDGDETVCIEFRDDGAASRGRSRRMLQPFATSRPEKRNGLGLAVAARIAAAYDGAMGLGDASDGAVFWVRLPFAEIPYGPPHGRVA